MKKSTWVLGAAALLALSVAVAGCGGGDKKEAAKGVKGELMVYTSIYPDIIDNMCKPNLAKAFPEMKVNWFQCGTEKVVTKITGEMKANKVGTDVLMVADPSYYLKLEKEGWLMPYKSKEHNNVIADKAENGAWYAVRVCNMIIAYNGDKLKAEDAPKSWAQVKEYAKIIKQKTGNMGFFMQEYADNWAQQAIIESNGGVMLKKVDGKVKAGFDSPEAAEAFQLMADMVKDGSGLHATNEEGFQAYLSGKLGMVCTTIGKRANFEKTAKFPVKVASFPEFEGKPVRVAAGGNFLMVFSKDAAKEKAAVEFIKYLQSPEALVKWSTGTGYLPPRKGIAEDPKGFKKMAEENQNIQVALSLMPKVVKWASFPGANGLQAEQMLIDVRDVILSGEKPAAEALKETAKKVNELL